MTESDKHYFEGIKALEDLYFLGGISVTPLINRIRYHFMELNNNKIPIQPQFISQFPAMEKLFSEMVNIPFQRYLSGEISKKSGLEKIDIILLTEEIKVDSVEKILTLIPDLLSLLGLLNYQGKLKISLTNENILIEGILKDSNEIQSKRESTYQITRSMFSRNQILTFSVEDIDIPGMTALNLFIDLRFDSRFTYVIEIGHHRKCSIGLPNLVVNYFLPKEDLLKKSKHLILEITDQMNLKHNDQVSFKEIGLDKLVSSGKEIIHFHFLFRPISLIIPRRGNIFPIENLFMGEKDSGLAKDLGENKNEFSAPLPYLDLFAYFSKK